MSEAVPSVRSQIPRTRQVNEGRKKPYIYEIQLILEDKSWTVELRYSALYNLHKEIRDQLRLDVSFPPKRVVNNKDPKFIELRRRELESWLEAILAHRDVVLLDCVHAKLEFPSECVARLRNDVSAPALSKRSSKTSRGSSGSYAWMDASARTSRSEDISVHSRHGLVPDTISAGMAVALSTPNTMTQDIATLLAEQAGTDGALDPLLLRAKPTRENGLALRAVHDYTGGSGDLSFHKGDTVTIVDQDPATGWWVGTKDNVEFGLVPVNLLAQIESS